MTCGNIKIRRLPTPRPLRRYNIHRETDSASEKFLGKADVREPIKKKKKRTETNECGREVGTRLKLKIIDEHVNPSQEEELQKGTGTKKVPGGN